MVASRTTSRLAHTAPKASFRRAVESSQHRGACVPAARVTKRPTPRTSTLHRRSTLPLLTRSKSRRKSSKMDLWRLPSLFSQTFPATKAVFTSGTVMKHWVDTQSKSWAGARRMVPPTGLWRTPGTLTGETMDTSRFCGAKMNAASKKKFSLVSRASRALQIYVDKKHQQSENQKQPDRRPPKFTP